MEVNAGTAVSVNYWLRPRQAAGSGGIHTEGRSHPGGRRSQPRPHTYNIRGEKLCIRILAMQAISC